MPAANLCRQKSWTTPIHQHLCAALLEASSASDRARLTACQAFGSGDWLYAFPATTLGLHLSDDQTRTAAALRLGAPVSLEHICVRCGSLADPYGSHALTCPRSTGRHVRHSLLNDCVNRALNSTKIPTRIEPTGLLSGSNIKPDGITLIPWTCGKPLAWDVTCAFPLAASWSSTVLRNPSAVATAVEARKLQKYEGLQASFCFEPLSVETLGGIGESSQQLLKKMGSRLIEAASDTRAAFNFRQRLAIAIEVGNYACLQETLPAPVTSLPPSDP